MFSFSRLPRIWLTAGVAVSIIGLLLIGFRSQYPGYSPTFYTPPPTSSSDQRPSHVDSHAQKPPPPPPPAGVGAPDTHPTQSAPSALPETSELQSLEDTKNATLGFEKLLVINFPDRTDKRDRMTLMGVSTGLHFSYLPAVDGNKVPDSAMPPKAEGWTGKVRGSWRAHMDALWYVVDNNLTSAVIFEDDLDWDIRIRDQARDFAVATRALLQPLAGRTPREYADPTYPTVKDKDAGLDPPPLSFEQLPVTHPPTTSPYGDHWDLLWLGHCGVQQPVGNPKEAWAERSRHISKGTVVKLQDPTVPQTNDIHSWDDDGHARFRDSYAPHTRIYHSGLDEVCTFAYAVSQAGARKILYDLGLWKMEDPFDLGLRQFCDGIMGHERHICLTTQPSLFSHYEHKDGSDLDHEKTWNIRWSARENLPKLLDGRTDFDDQWPDAGVW